MEFRLLGTVSVGAASGDLDLGPVKRRSLLAALLLRCNLPVPVDHLTDAMWEDEPPPRARGVVQGHVSRLRTLLAESEAEAYGIQLVTQGTAYVLRCPESLLDLHRFTELISLASAQTEPHDAALMYQEALALWQGPALTGVLLSPPLQTAAQELEDRRLEAVTKLAACWATLGEHARAASVLRPEAEAYPLRESLSAALVRSLYLAGRRSEGLDWFHRTRRLLSEELGIDPSPDLSAAYVMALQAETRLPAAPAAPADDDEAEPPAPAPRSETDLLPRAPRGFLGRKDERARLTALADSAPGVVLVTGPAGAGKSALAVRWAHDEAARFPDGRLYADLRGEPGDPAPAPHTVLSDFLRALGVPPQDVPDGAAGAGALFRRLCADLRLLVVLDNAPASAQVRPLLPDGRNCLTVVTSTRRLGGLVSSDQARRLPLGPLAGPESRAVLASGAGTARIDADPGAADELTALCAGLPSALRAVATRLADAPERTLRDFAGELADPDRRLRLLDVEDTGLRTALSRSYEALPPDTAALLTALARHHAHRTDPAAAAALTGTTAYRAEDGLDALTDAHLLVRAAPGHWELPDLVRLHAREAQPLLPAPADVVPLPPLFLVGRPAEEEDPRPAPATDA
ncbi:BTAD domain-containing putative transcriptional regulator [Streptomyces termitum]